MAMPCSSFEIAATLGAARAGLLRVAHGEVPTPAFMPVGTRATVRGLLPDELRNLGSTIVLANTYHLWVRPAQDIIQELGGLHAFMGWSGPILTDSGGFQVFSLRDRSTVSEEGVRIRSPEDGQYRTLTPETSVAVQEALGVDIAMAFDECLEQPADRDRTARSMERTTRWLGRSLAARRHHERTDLFGIVQGGLFADLRLTHAAQLSELDLGGYAIGGLSVGESREALIETTALTAAALPTRRPRYLMGVGHPHDIVDAVLLGVDMFDCVLPTRSGRHGHASTPDGRPNLRNGRYRQDPAPLDPACDCIACPRFSRPYLPHPIKAEELLGKRLVTVHNLRFYQRMLTELRAAIVAGEQREVQRIRAMAERSATAVA